MAAKLQAQEEDALTQSNFAGWEAFLKQKVFVLKKSSGKPVGHCYEAMAKEYGYNNYAAWRAAIKEYFNANT